MRLSYLANLPGQKRGFIHDWRDFIIPQATYDLLTIPGICNYLRVKRTEQTESPFAMQVFKSK